MSSTIDPARPDVKSFVVGCRALSSLRPQPRLGERSETNPQELEPLEAGGYCACNVTYISSACCESSTGTVWESPEMKIGEVRARSQDHSP